MFLNIIFNYYVCLFLRFVFRNKNFEKILKSLDEKNIDNFVCGAYLVDTKNFIKYKRFYVTDPFDLEICLLNKERIDAGCEIMNYVAEDITISEHEIPIWYRRLIRNKVIKIKIRIALQKL